MKVSYEHADEIMTDIQYLIDTIRWERNESSMLNTIKGLGFLRMMNDAEGFEKTVRRFYQYVNDYKGQQIEIDKLDNKDAYYEGKPRLTNDDMDYKIRKDG